MRDQAGQPVDNVVKKAAEDFLTTNEHALPTGPGPHKVTYDAGLGLGIVGVIDDTSLITVEVTVEIEFQMQEVPFRFRAYRDSIT